MKENIGTLLPKHPFYPLEAEIVGYLANEHSSSFLLTVFFTTCAALVLLTLTSVNRLHPNLPNSEKATILWFVFTGLIHIIFEGSFVFNHVRMGPRQDVLGQLWKEYAQADSRYLTSEAAVLSVEAITSVFWGPLSLAVAWFITTSNSLRHPMQALVSLGQLYGTIIYFGTSALDHYYRGVSYCRPEPLYFWFYFVFMNMVWIVLPSVLLYRSISASKKAFQALDKMSGMLHGNGHVKKSI